MQPCCNNRAESTPGYQAKTPKNAVKRENSQTEHESPVLRLSYVHAVFGYDTGRHVRRSSAESMAGVLAIRLAAYFARCVVWRAINFRLGAVLLIGVGMLGAKAQTNPPPSANPSASPGVSALTHCRDSRGTVKLKNGTSGPSETTGSVANSASNPGAKSRNDRTADIPRPTEAQTNLPACSDTSDR